MTVLKLKLFGNFNASWDDGEGVDVRSKKQKALLAMLATSSNGTHSREWLQQMLWSLGDREQGRVNLRRALFELRKCFGDRADSILQSNNADIWLKVSNLEITGDRRDGEFLEGIWIPEKGFGNWLDKQRNYGVSVAIRERPIESAQMQTDRSLIPTVAVLPLRTIVAHEDFSTLGDMISMELSRALSRSKVINVVSHLSSRDVGSAHFSMDTVREKLGADYVVYGSLRSSEGTFWADVDLASTKDGQILRTSQISATLSDLLNGQCETISELGTDIGYALINSALELAQSRPLPDLGSHEIYMASISGMHSNQLRTFAYARKGMEFLVNDRGIRDSRVHAWLAHWYMLSIPQGWAEDPALETTRANDCVSRALDINPNCSFSLAMSGMVSSSPGFDTADASALLTAARLQDPNNAFAWIIQSRMLSFRGQAIEAVQHADQALKLSPGGPQAYFFENIAATAHVVDANYERAMSLIDMSLARNPLHRSSLRVKAVAQELSGNLNGAKDTLTRLIRLDPDLTVDRYLASHPAGNFDTGMVWAESLARAGLPKN